MTELPKFRYRSFYFSWCNRRYDDKVCTKCDSIVVDDVCLVCTRETRKTAERLKLLKELKERKRLEREAIP